MRYIRHSTAGRRTTAALLALAMALWAGAAIAQAQEGSATLRGIVFDSTTMSALPGARVAVMGTMASGKSDEDGRFELKGVPSGEYWVSFYHPRLQNLGVSAPSQQVSFADGATAEVELTVPSEATLLLGWCLAEQPGPGHAAIAGLVTDSLTGAPVSHAIVTVVPERRRVGDPAPPEVRADESGYFRICGAPSHREVKVQARFGQSSGRSVHMTLAPGSATIQNLVLLVSAEGTLQGRVLDYSMTRDEIEPLLGRVQNAGDLLRNMNLPGFSVREIYIDDPVTGVRMPGLCVEVRRRSGGQGCRPAAVFVNGVYIPQPDQFLRSLDPNVVDRIEVLSPIDAHYQFGTLAGNGAVVIYTR